MLRIVDDFCFLSCKSLLCLRENGLFRLSQCINVNLVYAGCIWLWSILAGYGSIVQIYPGEGPVRAATSCFGFPKTFFDTLSEFPLSKVASVLSGTFSLTPLPSECEEKTPVAEDKNGSGGDKELSIPEVDVECSPKVAMESGQPEDQEIAEFASDALDDKAKGTVRSYYFMIV